MPLAVAASSARRGSAPHFLSQPFLPAPDSGKGTPGEDRAIAPVCAATRAVKGITGGVSELVGGHDHSSLRTECAFHSADSPPHSGFPRQKAANPLPGLTRLGQTRPDKNAMPLRTTLFAAEQNNLPFPALPLRSVTGPGAAHRPLVDKLGAHAPVELKPARLPRSNAGSFSLAERPAMCAGSYRQPIGHAPDFLTGAGQEDPATKRPTTLSETP